MFRQLDKAGGQTGFAVLSVAALGVCLMIAITLMHWQRPRVVTITPPRTGEVERCLTCHEGIESISASHSIEEFGCVSCHGGNGLSVSEDAAHEGMVVNPADAEHAQAYCGECHAGQVLTVERSIMTTYAGAISLIRHAFGAQTSDEAEYAVRAVGELEAFSPAPDDLPPIHTFAEMCQTCHVSAEAQQVEYQYRSTGCATCHVLYSDEGLYEGGDPTISKTEPGHGQTHTFTTAIPYTQCNHCHNRGNYDLRTMTFIPRDDLPPDETLSEEAQRAHDYYQPIAQFTRCEWELDCIDCHTAQEVMGDGLIYNDRHEAAYVQCKTCHGTLDELPESAVVQTDADLAMTRANLNPLIELAVGDTIMVTERGEPLYNIRLVDGEWILTGKATGETYSVPLVQGSTCTQDPDEQESHTCHECHEYDREAHP